MGTTNILDLNNRLTKVEKENVAQTSYTSLKNKPKINSVTLTGNKTLADIGAAAASDVGDITLLNTTDKSSCVGAINEVKAYQTRHYGAPVDITSATTSDLYTCPSDGFVTAEVNNSSDTSSLAVIDYDLNVVLISSGGTGGQEQIRNGCNVIKGQRLYNNIVNAAVAKVQFIPLVNS